MSKMNHEEVETIEDQRKKAALEMLVSEKSNGKGQFKADAKDKRFGAIL